MEKKICSKCKIEKEVCEFYSHPKKENSVRSRCKLCMNNYSFEYSQLNSEKVKKIKSTYIEKNFEKVKKSKKDWFVRNPSYQKNWCLNNYENDEIYRIKVIMRSRLRIFFKSKMILKNNKSFKIIGCSPNFLKNYIEKQFTDGMSWENYGLYGWHVDHIIPLSSAKTEEEVYELCHYTNLQPLWAEDNLKKGVKILS